MIALNFHDLLIEKDLKNCGKTHNFKVTVNNRDFGVICGGRALDQGRARISYRGGILISLRGLPKG